MKKLISVQEAAEFLSMRPAQVYEAIRQGIIPSCRIGRIIRIDPEQLEEYVKDGGKSWPGIWRKEA